MKALIKKGETRVYDIVADNATFETTPDFFWVNISDALADRSGLEYNPDTNTIFQAIKFLPEGSPKFVKNIKLEQSIVEFNGHVYQANQSSQDALSRNILAAQDTFLFLDVNNEKVEFTDESAKQLLKLMTDKTLQIIEEYHQMKADLIAQGFTEEELSLNPGYAQDIQ